MKDIVLLNTRTVFIVLLLGNTAFSLQNLPLTRTITDTRQRSVQSVQKHIAELLVAQGLEKSIARKRSESLFSSTHGDIGARLRHLQEHPAIALDKERIDKVLARRALFERPLELDTYDSLVGFVQETQSRPLNEKALMAVRQISTLNQTLSGDQEQHV